jgi:hypothetical protein
MGMFRDAMERAMALRGFAPKTRSAYLSWVRRLIQFCRVVPDQLTNEHVRAFLLHLTQQQATGSAGGLAEALPARRETVSPRGPNPSAEGDRGERVAESIAREMVLQIPRGVRPEVPEEVDLRAVAERDRERAATAM